MANVINAINVIDARDANATACRPEWADADAYANAHAYACSNATVGYVNALDGTNELINECHSSNYAWYATTARSHESPNSRLRSNAKLHSDVHARPTYGNADAIANNAAANDATGNHEPLRSERSILTANGPA